MEIEALPDAYALFRALDSLKLLEEKPPLWWPAYGTFEVVVGAVAAVLGAER